jgi:hypothetical protein
MAFALCVLQQFVFQCWSTTTTTAFESSSIDTPSVAHNNNNRHHHASIKRPCTQNPYLGAIGPLDGITAEMDKWLGNLTAIGSDSTSIRYRKHDHQRFFPFEEMAKCNSITCVGGACRKDDSKIVCGMEELQKQQQKQPTETQTTKKDKNDTNNTTAPPPPCVVYSIGGNNE